MVTLATEKPFKRVSYLEKVQSLFVLSSHWTNNQSSQSVSTYPLCWQPHVRKPSIQNSKDIYAFYKNHFTQKHKALMSQKLINIKWVVERPFLFSLSEGAI